MTARPAERVTVELRSGRRVTARRSVLDDAAGIGHAVATNLDHLARYLTWATAAAAEEAVQHDRLIDVARAWDDGVDFAYTIVDDATDAVIGTIGLMSRQGPGTMEIGYWLVADRVGEGIATLLSRALTTEALALDGVRVVVIRCDEQNEPSRSVPRRLGFTMSGIELTDDVAPGESGRLERWTMTLDDWDPGRDS